MNKRELGHRYEETAAWYLKSLGYAILELNYRTKFGEIDIIAKKDGCISFIEVKYRKTDAYGMPSAAVGRKKQMHIIKASEVYLASYGLTGCQRSYDVAEILGNKIRVIKNCFGGL